MPAAYGLDASGARFPGVVRWSYGGMMAIDRVRQRTDKGTGMSTFDEKAASWDDDPEKVERARVVAEAVRSAIELRRGDRLLDFGAGTGLLAQHLADHVGGLTLVDPSSGMREVCAAKVADGQLPQDTQVWDADLVTGPLREQRFDVVASLMTLHHVDDVAGALSALVGLLDAGGRVALVDLVTEDGTFHDDDFAGHHGFDPAAVADQLSGLGLVDVRTHSGVHDVEKNGRRYPLFLVTGRKA
jgi:cyclopropane fatty-acyl-phospholipid synthase-like methyltransferase